MRTSYSVLYIIILLLCSKPFADAHSETDNGPFAIYDSDDRYDLYEEKSLLLRTLARSTVALIESRNLKGYRTGVTEIIGSGLKETYNLCPTERFIDQQIAPVCSGVLIGSDIVLTAGHCVPNMKTCSRMSFVFGFHMASKEESPRSVPSQDVYACAELLHSETREDWLDFALIRLDRPVFDRTPVSHLKRKNITYHDKLVMLGHPLGLPMKVAKNISVLEMDGPFIVTDADAYSGNSGSPVFHATSGTLEGILVAGDEDFIMKKGCNITKHCRSGECLGEDVIDFSYIQPYLKKHLNRATPRTSEAR